MKKWVKYFADFLVISMLLGNIQPAIAAGKDFPVSKIYDIDSESMGKLDEIIFNEQGQGDESNNIIKNNNDDNIETEEENEIDLQEIAEDGGLHSEDEREKIQTIDIPETISDTVIEEIDDQLERPNADVSMAGGSYIVSYHVGEYVIQTDTNGNVFATIDGNKYNYSDSFDLGELTAKAVPLENKNILYELNNDEIVKAYTMPEVLYPKITIEPSVKEGVIYQNGKFSQNNFELIVKISNNMQSNFNKDYIMQNLSSKERDRLSLSVKKLLIEPSGGVNFGSSGWWIWKEYQREITENLSDTISIGATKEYKYKVNLEDKNALTGMKEYNIELYITPTYDIGVGNRKNTSIKIGNLDYQEEKTNEKKELSNSGQALTETSKKLEGLSTAIQFTGNYFSNSQIDEINEFTNLWISELILAKYVDKSDLKEKVTEKIADKWLKKMGLSTSMFTVPGQIRATTFLESKTKDGDRVYIQFDINLSTFKFGNSGMPTMASGSGSVVVYDKTGKELDSSIILPAYADVCAFCEQLQKVAKNTIFGGAKEYLGIFGISADSTAEALSSQLMAKLLNNKYTKDVFRMVNAKDMKSALKAITVKAEDYGNNKIFELLTTPSKKRTEVNIKCPVDVKVYDNDGNLCGVINNNKVDYNYSDIYITVVGEQKNIYLVGDDYTFELSGTDEGTMDYIVKEFDENGNSTREISYKNITLTDRCKYYSFVPETENLSSTLFDLTDESGNIISPTVGADEEYVEENIEIVANGICGDNLTWTLDKKGVLRIIGTGEMYDYEDYYEPLNFTPWKEIKSQIKYVLIEDGVTSIGNDSFYKCENLQHVCISDTVTDIGSYAFYMCYSLKGIVIPENVNIIGEYAFGTNYINRALERIVVRGNAPTVASNTFSYVFGKLIIPPNAVGYNTQPWTQMAIYSGNQIYGKCGDNLTWELNESGELTINGSGDMYHFYHQGPGVGSYQSWLPPWEVINSQIKKIIINAEMTEIGDDAFYYCKDVLEVSISPGVMEIGNQAFYGCSSLENIRIPESVTKIGRSAFSGCSELKSISILGDVTSLGPSVFYNCSSLRDIKFAKRLSLEGVWDDFSGTFNSCSSLINIDIPEGVRGLSNGAFKDCTNLISVSIPKSVTYIWNDVFDNCINLSTIYCYPDSYAETFAKDKGFQYSYIDEKCNHSLKTTLTKATAKKDGKSTQKCTKCGYTKTTVIPKIKSVKLSTEKYVYNGKAKKPNVSILDSNGKKIPSKNYSVTYAKGRKNVGTYSVKVVFKEDYSGISTKTFTIVPKGTSLSKLTAKSKGFTVKWKKQTTQVTGYQIQYSTSKSFSSKTTKTITKNSTTSATYKGLKAKKKYYVRIRTYKTVSGTKYYSSWSSAKTVTTKK